MTHQYMPTCLQYIMTPTKTFPLSYMHNVRFLKWMSRYSYNMKKYVSVVILKF